MNSNSKYLALELNESFLQDCFGGYSLNMHKYQHMWKKLNLEYEIMACPFNFPLIFPPSYCENLPGAAIGLQILWQKHLTNISYNTIYILRCML